MAQLFKVLPEVEELAKQHFELIYRCDQVKEKCMEYKEHLVIACLYLSCRQHNTFYTLMEIARIAKCNVFVLGRAYKTSAQLLNLNLEQPGIGVLSRELFSQSKLLVNVISRAHQLLHLSGKFWLVSGRNPIGLLSAVAFLSWKADKPVERCKTTIQKFCKEHNLSCSPMVKKRIQEIEDILYHLALQLPWVKIMPTKERIPFLIPDILKYQNTLFQEMQKRSKLELMKKSNHDRKESEKMNKVCYGEILPPIMKKQKKESTTAIESHSIVSSDDCEGEELEKLNVDEYIRSEKEVEILKKLHSDNII